MTPKEIAALVETETFYAPLTVARGAQFDKMFELEGLPLGGETLRAQVSETRNGEVVTEITAVVEEYTTPTFDELQSANPAFILPEGMSGSDTARLALIRLTLSETASKALRESYFKAGGDIEFVWDCYAITTLHHRLYAGEFILSEGTSYA